MKNIVLVMGLAVAFALAWAGPATAAEGKKKGGIIVLDAIKVEGRIQKPNAFYILQRTNLNFTSLELRRSFLEDVEKSVLDTPF